MNIVNQSTVSSGLDEANPWKVELSKYLKSEDSYFLMDQLDYQQWYDSEPEPVMNTGCHQTTKLAYNMYGKSWIEDLDDEFDIVAEP